MNIHAPATILALSPHTDDIEFGCGGLLSRAMREGATVHVAVFSFCEQSVPKGLHKDVLHEEFAASMNALGVPDERRHGFDYPVRNFGDFRQEILQNLVDLRSAVCPDLIVAPASTDIHQDHAVIAREAQRAFKSCSLLGYEMPWNSTGFSADLFCRIEDRDLALKVKMLGCYKSQSHRSYASADFSKSLARVRGVQANCAMAEAFEVYKLIV